MTSSSPPQEPASLRPGAAAVAGWHGMIQFALMVAIFLLINILSCQRFVQADTSREAAFTLSEVSRQVLDGLEEEVRIVVAFVRASPVRDRTLRLARAYADARPGAARASVLDPVRDPEAARDLSRRFGHNFRDNAVLLIKGERVEVVAEESLVIVRTDRSGERSAIGYRGEDAITSGLLRLLEDDPARIYLVTGKGPWPPGTQGNGAETLERLLPRQHAELVEFSFDEGAGIPADADALIIANPRYDFSGAEIRAIRTFWEKRKGGLVVLVNPEAATPNLDAFLRYHGIVPDRRTPLRLTDGPVGSTKEYSVAVRFVPGSPLTDPFLNTDSRFPGTSACLDVLETDAGVRTRGLRPTPLAISADGYWGESDPEERAPEFDENLDKKGPLILAASTERAAVEEAGVRVPAARMVVFANPHLLNPDALLQPNVDFFLSALNWSMDRSRLVGIGPSQPVFYQVSLTGKQSRTIHALLLLALPGAAILAAWLVHQRRRS